MKTLKPTGEPRAQVDYTDVSEVTLTRGRVTLQANLDLANGCHLAFEIGSRGVGAKSVPVLELLQQRCQRAAG